MFSPSHHDQSRWKPSYIKGMFEGISEHLDELGRTSKRSCVNELGRTSKMSDRGLRNRGEVSKELSSMRCQITQIGVESPEQLGRTERHGGLLKAMVIRVIAELQLVGKEAIQHVLTQSVMTKNSLSRVRGFAPSQWVLGKLPKESGTEPLWMKRIGQTCEH